jgi:hypothetical protein
MEPTRATTLAPCFAALSSYGAEFDAVFVRDGGFSSDVTTQWALDSEGSVSWPLAARLKARGQPRGGLDRRPLDRAIQAAAEEEQASHHKV